MQRLNPFGGTDPEVFETVLDTGVRVSLTKEVKHVFNDNDRVVVRAPGHFHHGAAGKITDSRSDTRLRVKLDSGHEVTASHEDLIPEALAPAAESVKILKRALDSGVVSDRDRARIETCLEKARTGDFAMSPFGELHSNDPFTQLRIYAEKYAPSALRKGDGVVVGSRALHVPSGARGTGNKAAWSNPMLVEDDDVLAKRSGDSFKIGDFVKDRITGKKGKITRIEATHADIDYGNGVTGICLRGYFEAAA
jgi:hypothetical protein